jgi:hypothetical protein
MRIVTGKVVGNTVVLNEPLPEGANVEVLLANDYEYQLTPAMILELREADAEYARGEYVDFDELWAQLPPR